jgi:hypothetical protein
VEGKGDVLEQILMPRTWKQAEPRGDGGG